MYSIANIKEWYKGKDQWLVLDKAATVEEAIELLKQYNIYFSGGIECHYLIADASGHSVIVEYVNQELCVVEAVQSKKRITS